MGGQKDAFLAEALDAFGAVLADTADNAGDCDDLACRAASNLVALRAAFPAALEGISRKRWPRARKRGRPKLGASRGSPLSDVIISLRRSRKDGFHGETRSVSNTFGVAAQVALWLANPDVDRACDVVDATVTSCPPRRVAALAPLLYQLSSRLAAHGDRFQRSIETVLLRLVDAAPPRTMLQLVALANGDMTVEARARGGPRGGTLGVV